MICVLLRAGRRGDHEAIGTTPPTSGPGTTGPPAPPVAAPPRSLPAWRRHLALDWTSHADRNQPVDAVRARPVLGAGRRPGGAPRGCRAAGLSPRVECWARTVGHGLVICAKTGRFAGSWFLTCEDQRSGFVGFDGAGVDHEIWGGEPFGGVEGGDAVVGVAGLARGDAL